jgi:hypothetical protein
MNACAIGSKCRRRRADRASAEPSFRVVFYEQWIATGLRPREDAIIDAAARRKRAA